MNVEYHMQVYVDRPLLPVGRAEVVCRLFNGKMNVFKDI